VRKKQNKKNPKVMGAATGVRTSGKIRRLFPDDSYGFILTPDEQEIFFHEASLKDLVMADLDEGDEVFFSMEEGDKGPQASWVRAATA
jgi:cold shock CspA family protein